MRATQPSAGKLDQSANLSVTEPFGTEKSGWEWTRTEMPLRFGPR
jgi:hypothetical protein